MRTRGDSGAPSCRFCRATLQRTILDLGMSPLCERFLSEEQLNQMEPFYPLRVHVCDKCLLVQLEAYVSAAQIFDDYAYFSSYSETWVEHARLYAEQMIEQCPLGSDSRVIELASNDGYLLQHFVERRITVLGVEPAANIAAVAVRRGIPTVVRYFGENTARELAASGISADLMVANNVLAQVPDLNDFIRGMGIVLAPRGVITVEFPHLMRTIQENQFDQVYHEHFSYFSFTTARTIFSTHGLTLFDVEELPTHGGSLRIFARHADDASRPVGERVREMLAREEAAGFTRLDVYADFGERVRETKREFLSFLIQAKREGKSIVGYGAPGKGNTLLNYCGIGTDFIDYTVDRSPHKQSRFLPGTHIPIFHPDVIRETRPDYVVILPWNLKTEIMGQLADIRDWGGRFVVPIPDVRIFDPSESG